MAVQKTTQNPENPFKMAGIGECMYAISNEDKYKRNNIRAKEMGSIQFTTDTNTQGG